jgi:2-(1,2-epoxy-1,2-dihydrophenyl)acetyl-CoA isomerase
MFSEQVPGIAAERRGDVLHVVLDRPERKNSLTPDAVRALIAVLEAAATDDGLRVVLLTGRGDDFCSGADWVASNVPGAPRPRTASST